MCSTLVIQRTTMYSPWSYILAHMKVCLCNDPQASLSVRPSVHLSVTNFNIGDILDTIYSSYESWPKGSLWGNLQNNLTLGDLDLWSTIQYLLEIWNKSIFVHFDNILDTIQSRVMRLGQKAACVETFK